MDMRRLNRVRRWWRAGGQNASNRGKAEKRAHPQPLPQAGGEKKVEPLPQAGGEKKVVPQAGAGRCGRRLSGTRTGGCGCAPRLDALYFILYGVFDPANPAASRDDIAYIYSTFPIVERQETARWGHYRSRDLALAWVNALMAGQPDADVSG